MQIIVVNEINANQFEYQINSLYKKFYIDHIDTHIGKRGEFIAIVFFDEVKKNLDIDLNMPVSDLAIPSISKNALRRNNILTVGELLEYLREDPEGRFIRYLGNTGIRAIRKSLQDLGVRISFDK